MPGEKPSAEACRRRDELARTTTYLPRAFALYIDEVDRVAREVDKLAGMYLTNTLRAELQSLTLPDPPDPLVEVIRQAILPKARDKDAQKLRAALAEYGLVIVKKETGDE